MQLPCMCLLFGLSFEQGFYWFSHVSSLSELNLDMGLFCILGVVLLLLNKAYFSINTCIFKIHF